MEKLKNTILLTSYSGDKTLILLNNVDYFQEHYSPEHESISTMVKFKSGEIIYVQEYIEEINNNINS
jgi:glutathione synthase/RimK-type ligase-like ATP-grasp enzyme